MRYKTTETKNTVQYTIIQDITKNGKRTTCVYENIGNYDKLKLRAGTEDPIKWLNNYVEELNQKQKEDSLPVIIRKNPNKIIDKDVRVKFNIGYLFLQDLYYKLKLDTKDTYSPNYIRTDLTDILHEKFGFRTDYETIREKNLKKVCKDTKK